MMLNERLRAYLNYFERLATQPANHWEGFYIPERERTGFNLRLQLAFACYALAACCMHPEAGPAEQQRCRDSMAALIDRMLQRRVWAYWALLAEQQGLNPSPLLEANADYSSHLAMMIGLYELAGGDRRYDDSFTLIWSPTERYTSTHTALVEALWQQMRQNDHHSIESEPGTVSTTAMPHALWATALHDHIHDSSYAAINREWLTFLRERLVLPGRRLFGHGIFQPVYNGGWRLLGPPGANMVDAWVLALLVHLAPDMVHELAPRLLSKIRHVSPTPDAPPRAYVPGGGLGTSREYTDQTLSTGFGYLLAVELEDEGLAAALLGYADEHFQPDEQNDERCYGEGIAPVYTTALFALGEAGGLRHAATLLANRTPAEPDEQNTRVSVAAPGEEHTRTRGD